METMQLRAELFREMNPLLDTNILIDYIQARAGGDDAKQLLMRGRNGEVPL